MVPTGRVRDRAKARPRSGDGGNDFVGLVPAKWWGPVVLDADPKAPSCLATSAREPPNLSGSRDDPELRFAPLKRGAGMARLWAEGSNGQIERTLIWPGQNPVRAMPF